MTPRSLIREKNLRLYLPQSPAEEKTQQDLGSWRLLEAVCVGTDAEGDFVHVRTDKAAGYYQVEKADPTDISTMPVFGVIEEKVNPTRCFVRTEGIVAASGLTPGAPYFVGLDAQIDGSPPIPSIAGYAVTQEVGYALSSTELLLRFSSMRIKRG